MRIEARNGATVVSKRAMPWSSGRQPSPAVISDREKRSVAYRCRADGPAVTLPVRGVPANPAVPEPAGAGRTAAPAPSAPIVPATTQVAAATANSGRRPRSIKGVIHFPTESLWRGPEPKTHSPHAPGKSLPYRQTFLGSLRFVNGTRRGSDGKCRDDHATLALADRREHLRGRPRDVVPGGEIDVETGAAASSYGPRAPPRRGE